MPISEAIFERMRRAAAEYETRFELETKRRTSALEHLWRIADSDSTVRTFIEAWRHGAFPSFEEMLCQLCSQLATEKAGYLRTAERAIAERVLQEAPEPCRGA